MKRPYFAIIAIAVALLGLVAMNAFFIVHQTQYALVLWFGEARRVILKPGLYLKMPVAETVVSIDNRVLPIDVPQQLLFASDRKQLVVDAFARYRIKDPQSFYRAFGSEATARSRLEGYLSSAVRNTVAAQSFAAILTDKRANLMLEIRDTVNAQVTADGVQLVDVRLRRADLPEANSKSIYERMRTERQQEAAAIRAEGDQKKLEIRARADREVTVILAEARQQADILRGQGEAERNKIFGDAANKDPEFFNFYRSLRAYEEAMAENDTTFVLEPRGDFFKYFGDSTGGGR